MSNKKSIFKKILALCSMVLLISLAGCSFHNGIRMNSSFSSGKAHLASSFGSLTGKDGKYINLKKGQKVSFKYTSAVEGNFTIKFVDSDGNTIIELETNKTGSETIEIQKDGKYKLVLEGDNAKGSYDISWEIKK